MVVWPLTMSLERFTPLFPLWTLLGAALAMVYPPLFSWFSGPWITVGLGLIMLGMGLGLVPQDFLRVSRQPRPVIVGVLAQFLVMPTLAALIAAALRLPSPLAVGLILVGCCPGGTASNVVALIARADVALSVVMPHVSTLAAVVLDTTVYKRWPVNTCRWMAGCCCCGCCRWCWCRWLAACCSSRECRSSPGGLNR